MSSYTIEDLRSACERYLRTRPDHSFGFCWWACVDAENASTDDVYERIAPLFHEYRELHPEIGVSSYVSPRRGCVPERVAFVEWMLDQIT